MALGLARWACAKLNRKKRPVFGSTTVASRGASHGHRDVSSLSGLLRVL